MLIHTFVILDDFSLIWAYAYSGLTVFDLRHVPNHHLSDRDLDDVSIAHHSEALLQFDAALQTPKLFLFAPVIESGHQHHTNDR